MASEERSQNLLTSTLDDMPLGHQHCMTQGKSMGAWLTILPTNVCGTILSKDEFHDGIYLQYGYTPPDLLLQCNGCHQCFSVEHALQCKKRGLVVAQHNEICNEVRHLAAIAFTPNAVCNEPSIHQVAPCMEMNAQAKTQNLTTDTLPAVKHWEDHGDLLIHGL